MIKAVIFDMDGLLIDSEPFWQDSELTVFRSMDLPFTRDMCHDTVGLRIDEVVQHWHQQFQWDLKTYTLDLTAKKIMQGVIDRIKSQGEKLPGVDYIIDFFIRNNVPLALASSSSFCVIDAVMKRLDIGQHFSIIHSAESEACGKPHPAIFLSTAEKLTIKPLECLVFEDSLNGVIAAKAARMKCIAVPELSGIDNPQFSIADITIESLLVFGEEQYRMIVPSHF